MAETEQTPILPEKPRAELTIEDLTNLRLCVIVAAKHSETTINVMKQLIALADKVDSVIQEKSADNNP